MALSIVYDLRLSSDPRHTLYVAVRAPGNDWRVITPYSRDWGVNFHPLPVFERRTRRRFDFSDYAVRTKYTLATCPGRSVVRSVPRQTNL